MSTKSTYRGAGRLRFFDNVTYETTGVMAPVFYSDDFLGAGKLVVPAAGSAESGMDWVKKIVGAAPRPLLALPAVSAVRLHAR
jgi:hypothetical protein